MSMFVGRSEEQARFAGGAVTAGAVAASVRAAGVGGVEEVTTACERDRVVEGEYPPAALGGVAGKGVVDLVAADSAGKPEASGDVVVGGFGQRAVMGEGGGEVT
ncbi:hypothetical protein [Streptomyces phaeochromogenes]|uniref:hypothetical protein n=1 Tax=Streptomyces phaeochromogenes TaxID=1923 RepID=UPI00371400AD